jgi:chloramphenicol 3-O phosphotransferase
MEHLIPGKIILLNGASSAGKSTLCRAVQAEIDEPFLQFSLDFLMFDTGVLPKRHNPSGPFSWASMKPKLFQGYFGCLTALARAGNNLVLDYLLETHEQLEQLVRALKTLDVFFVGVHCPQPELERRERERGDRPTGDARRDFGIVHNFSSYDFEIDSTHPVETNANAIIAAWNQRTRPGVFDALAMAQTDA